MRAKTARIAVIGAGHVGLVYAAGLAALGQHVRVADTDAAKVRGLARGRPWFHEPGLPELVRKGLRRRLLSFTTSYRRVLADADFVFVCVPTPTTADGSLDDSALRLAFTMIRRNLGRRSPIIVNKSTVPIGTGDLAHLLFGERRLRIVSNPEFLAQGRALEDFFHPHRLVFGAADRDAAIEVADLFAPLKAQLVFTDNVTAEFSKLAANVFLAMKVSFANVLARLSSAVGADAAAVTEILSLDPRIGRGHLRPGLGFGGSCLPKDTAAIEHIARKYNATPELFASILRVNRDQRARVIDRLVGRFGSLAGRRIALLGLAFKAHTDDVRDSPAIALGAELLALNARLTVHDPFVRRLPEELEGARVAASALAAARSAEALVVATDWPQFAELNLAALRRAMRDNVLVDARDIFSPRAAARAGFDYFALK